MSSTNTAAWLPSAGAPLTVGAAPVPVAAGREIVVRTRAVAINPIDWIVQRAPFTYGWLRYPAVLGTDVAGEVVAVGPAVTRFAAGDRVAGYAVGLERDPNRPAEGGFQELVVLREDLTAPLPDDLAFEAAAVLPLAVSTAASALFRTAGLALRHPSAAPEPTGSAVLVWGAATSVGLQAVQLARAAGYEVVATASPRSAALVRSLGAAAVVDRRDPGAVRSILEALDGRPLAGALAIGAGSTPPCLAVVRAARGAKRLVSASTSRSLDGLRPGRGALLRALPTLLPVAASVLGTAVAARRSGIRASTVIGSTLKDDEVGPAIWRDFLPAALAEGRYRAAPAAEVVGTGLADVQAALEAQRRGVSARKLVVTL